MPLIKSAQKKLKQDKKRKAENDVYKKAYKGVIHDVKKAVGSGKKVSGKELSNTFSKIDKAAKNRVIHKNKAARLKSRVSTLIQKKP